MNNHFFVWCLMRQRNGGLNSGQKSANIVTDAYYQIDKRHKLNIFLVKFYFNSFKNGIFVFSPYDIILSFKWF